MENKRGKGAGMVCEPWDAVGMWGIVITWAAAAAIALVIKIAVIKQGNTP